MEVSTGRIVLYGVLACVLSGMLGIGGGIVLVPVMVSLLGLSQHEAHATSLAVIIPTAAASALVYGLHGQLDFSVAAMLTAGSVVGAAVGSRWMSKIPAAQLKRMFGVFLALVGLRMVVGG